MHNATQRIVTVVGLLFTMFLIAKPVTAQSTSEQEKLMQQQTIDVDPVTGKRVISNVDLNSGPHVNGQRGMNNGKKSGGTTIMSAPAAPPGFTSTTTNFTNSTPVIIPTTVSTVTSTITVSGAGPYLFDFDLTTFIAHTFCSDLDITLMSPAGTIVTITTDNGGGNDSVYNGTLWDDDANPLGQVPYTTNQGLVTDHLYTTNVVATPLVPEEPFGAFIGENPNGVWTITISDDATGDGGRLSSWTLAVTTLPSAPTTSQCSATQTTPLKIPGIGVVSSTLTVSCPQTYLLDLNLRTFIGHTFASDLDITLQSPAGTIVTITTDNGSGNDSVWNGTYWDDDADTTGQVPYTSNNGLVTDQTYVTNVVATPLDPEESMAAFIGENPNGVWTLTVSDDAAGDSGRVASWGLDLTTVGAVDNTAPSCAITQIIPGPPKQLQVTVQDLQSGLASIVPVTVVNATLNIPSFTVGTTSPVVVTATKINQSQSATVVLQVTDVAGNTIRCDPVYTTISGELPQEFSLGSNYPNPFNPTTKININVAKTEGATSVSLKIFDLLGREVKTLISEPMQAGQYYVEWDGTNNQGVAVTSGVYLYRMVAGDFIATRRMTLMK